MSRKILVVDDSAFMRAILKNILVDAGYEVIGEAGDGKDAIEKYKELKPELVTMDVTMPDVNGIEAARSIIDYDKDANIIICTAMGQDWMITDAYNLGIKDFLLKPFKRTEVLEKVARIFQQRD
ncbi:MAG: response regulator [Halanaerobiales bacterium]|mgnify:FL=1